MLNYINFNTITEGQTRPYESHKIKFQLNFPDDSKNYADLKYVLCSGFWSF